MFFIVANTSLWTMGQSGDAPPEIDDDWRLKKEKEDITIYSRWIHAENGRKARQLHANMVVRSSLSAAVMALAHDELVKKWYNRVKEHEHYASGDPFYWHSYTEFNIPWPLNNQDLIAENVLSQEEDSKKIRIEITARPDYMPRKQGIDRMTHFKGLWNFTPLSEDLIRIDYYIFTKTDPEMPRWITDPIIERGLWSTFNELKKTITEIQSKNVSLSYIEN